MFASCIFLRVNRTPRVVACTYPSSIRQCCLVGFSLCKAKGEGFMPHLRSAACHLLSKTLLAAIFGASWLTPRAGAQTNTTTDSLLNTGSVLSETSNAPGTNGAVGLVHSSSNSATNLWLIDTNLGL